MNPLALLLLLPASQDPAARWALDGTAEPGKGVGRIEFIDSPVGGRGQMLALNGVDASVESAAPDVGAGDFSVSAWVFPFELRPAGIASRTDGRQGWSLGLLADGSFRFESAAGTIQTAPKAVFPAQWYHVVASVKRGESGKASALHVNGEPAAAADIRAVALDLPAALSIGRRPGDAKPFCGLVDDVRVYAKALSAEEAAGLTDAGLPWLRRKARGRTPFAGKFELAQDDVVAFTGGENAFAAQQHPYLEALLHLDDPGRRLFCRTLAWEGDTVFEQWRVLNFAPWERQFERIGASILFCQFGQMESLAGKERLPDFEAAYGKLLDEFEKRTRRIVLLSPVAFEPAPSPAPDLSRRNEDARLYAQAIRRIAEKRGLLFVDLFGPTAKGPAGITRDGVHLSAAGYERVARIAAEQLGLRGGDPAALLPHLERKNRIWLDSWRPTNWAFLNGDRMEQPSSRDHKDRRVRWFPVEVQTAQALIRAEELKVEDLLRAVKK